MAKLHFKYGAMNSGKTDILIKTAYNYTERGLNVIVVKPSIDTKGGKTVVTRAGGRRDVDILISPKSNVQNEVRKYTTNRDLSKIHCVLVDEAQLLTKNQIDQLFSIAKHDNISVITYGLRTDFLSSLFAGSKRLLALADNIEKIPTMCRCGSQAEFNCRKIDNQFVFSGNQIAIDGESNIAYESLCGVCYLNAKSKETLKAQQ